MTNTYDKSRDIAQDLCIKIPDFIYETKKEHQELLHDLLEELYKFIKNNFETPENEIIYFIKDVKK